MSREKALGDGWMNGVHPDDRDWISLEWKSLVKKGETWGQEYRFLSEDGVTTWVYGLASPLKDEQGQITGFIGINLNITKRKHTEEMLRESEDRFRTFFEGSPDSIILAEIDSGRVIDANPAALKLLGRTHEEVVGMHQGELHPPELSGFASTSFHEHVQQVQFQDHTDPIETVILRKDGTRIPVEVIAKLIHLKGSPIIHGTFRDIVKRKEAEEERERLLTEIEEKQEELQRVIYVASHDLRSPLVNVRGFSEELGSAAGKIESLVRDRRLPAEIMDELEEIIREDLHESVKYIGTSITKMESLIGGLLRISRIGSVKIVPETIDMNHLLTEIRETFEFRLKDGPITLTIGDLPPCYGDPDQMNQVFSNLIDNSIKYLHPDRGGEIEISGRTDGKGVLYSVQDNGIGIPEEHLKSIFDIFHRVGEGGVNGEGLGLTAVKRILDRHGGRIRVESRQGEGSTFHIFMPGSSIVEGM
jgi:PAS domain S-box-containing protein